MSNGNLQKELAYFKANQALLVQKHEDKFLVIKDQEVKGVYDSEIDAYTEAQKTFELGTFFNTTVVYLAQKVILRLSILG